MQLLVCECHAVQGHSGIPLFVLRDDHRMLASFRFRVEPNSPPAPDLLVRVLRKSRNTVCVFSVNHIQVDYAPIAPERLSVPLLLFQSVLHQERGHHRFFQPNSRFHGFSVSWIESGVGSVNAQNGGSFAVHAQCVFLVERSQLLRDHPQSAISRDMVARDPLLRPLPCEPQLPLPKTGTEQSLLRRSAELGGKCLV